MISNTGEQEKNTIKHLHRNSAKFNTMIEEIRNYKGNLKRVKNGERTNLINEQRKYKSGNHKKYWKIINGQKKCQIPIYTERTLRAASQ